MDQDEQNNYNVLYAQRLENLLHEQIRKTIDVEVRLSLTWEKLEESQKTSAIQADIIKQATNSIEILTGQNKKIESDNEEFRLRIVDLENKLNASSEIQKDMQISNTQKDSKIKELEREITRVEKELQTTYDDLTAAKETKIINKK